jgi:hypothetical protein
MGDPAIINVVINQTSFTVFFCIGSASLRPSICKCKIVTSPVNKFSLFLCLLVCRQSSLLTGEEGKEPNHTTARESLVLYIYNPSTTVLSDPSPLPYILSEQNLLCLKFKV